MDNPVRQNSPCNSFYPPYILKLFSGGTCQKYESFVGSVAIAMVMMCLLARLTKYTYQLGGLVYSQIVNHYSLSYYIQVCYRNKIIS